MLEKGITYLMTRLSLVSISNVQDVQISGNWLEKSRIGINIWKKFPVKIVGDPGAAPDLNHDQDLDQDPDHEQDRGHHRLHLQQEAEDEVLQLK
jgi:hypothetical protein